MLTKDELIAGALSLSGCSGKTLIETPLDNGRWKVIDICTNKDGVEYGNFTYTFSDGDVVIRALILKTLGVEKTPEVITESDSTGHHVCMSCGHTRLYHRYGSQGCLVKSEDSDVRCACEEHIHCCSMRDGECDCPNE